MSIYINRIADALADTLEHALKTQPEQFAGYVTNLDFWFSEYAHLKEVNDDLPERVQKMKNAYDRFLTTNDKRAQNRDDVGAPYQAVSVTTSREQRIAIIERCRKALLAINERALRLGIIDFPGHDDFASMLE